MLFALTRATTFATSFGIGAAHAVEPTMDASLSASYWGLGTKVVAHPGLKFALWNKPDNILFSDTFLHAQVGVELTPAYARLVPTITFSPIAVLELQVHYAASTWFGSFSTLKAFDDPDAVYSDAALAEIDGEAGFGHRVGGEATLQAKAGPMVIALWGDAERWSVTPFAGRTGAYFFESERELLFAWDETYLSGNGVLLYEHTLNEEKGQVFRVGAIGNYSTALTTQDVLFRAGLLGTYSPSEHWTFVVIAQPYLISRAFPTTFPPYLGAQVRWKL